jgi:Protein of unknown function (DUF1778)
MPAPARRKDDVIQIRALAEAKAILNRAAALRGQELSEFMLESACPIEPEGAVGGMSAASGATPQFGAPDRGRPGRI